MEIWQLEVNPLFYCGSIWQENLNAGHLIWILNQTFALVDISFQDMWFHIKCLAFREGLWF
jgi:hypothetical protein